MKYTRWSENEINIIKNSYRECPRTELLIKLPGRTWGEIKACGTRLKIQRLRPSKHKLNKLLEDTPEAYYWIGFLLADGCFTKNRISLGLAEYESYHVTKFKQFINYPNTKENRQVGPYDTKIVPLIIKKFGIKLQKTYNPPVLPEMSDNLFISMLIGYLDGDGNVRFQPGRKDYQIRVLCHSSWLAILNSFLNRITKITNYQTNQALINSKGYAVMYMSSKIACFLKQKILDLKLPILNRKWDFIDNNYVTHLEKRKSKEKFIKSLMMNNLSRREISKTLNLKYDSVVNIVRFLDDKYQKKNSSFKIISPIDVENYLQDENIKNKSSTDLMKRLGLEYKNTKQRKNIACILKEYGFISKSRVGIVRATS